MLLNNNSFRSVGALGMLMVVAGAANAGSLAPQKASAGSRTVEQGRRMLAARSARFIENKGQWNADARFLAKGKGLNLWYTDQGIRYDQRSVGKRGAQVVDMYFVGGSGARPVGTKRAKSTLDIYHANKAVTNIATYDEVVSKNVVPGVSMRSYFDNGHPRYDLVLAAGAKPSALRLGFRHADGLAVQNGALRIGTHLGGITNGKPFAYQTVDGSRVPVSASWVVKANTASFKIGAYNASRPLVIDPLVFGTYFGGENGPDEVRAATVDPITKGLIVVGSSSAPDFPATSFAFTDTLNPEGVDAFISRLAPDGQSTDFSVLVGGQGDDVAQYVKLDATNNIWIAGTTISSGRTITFPHGVQTIVNGNSTYVGGFLGTLAPNAPNYFVARFTHGANNSLRLGTLASSTTGGDTQSLVIGVNGSQTVTKPLTGFDLRPTSNGAVQFAVSGIIPTPFGANQAELNSEPLAPVLVTGPTNTAFPGHRCGFLLRFDFDPARAASAYYTSITGSQYIEGTRRTDARGVVLDTLGNLYTTGAVFRPDFGDPSPINIDTGVNPTVFQTTPGALSNANGSTVLGRILRGTDVFVRKYDTAGTLVFSGLIGGNGDEEPGGFALGLDATPVYTGPAIAVDSSGNMVVTGSVVGSQNFPVTAGTFGGGFTPPGGSDAAVGSDVFVSKISADGTKLLLSTNLRTLSRSIPNAADAAFYPSVPITVEPAGIILDGNGNVYMSGNLRPYGIVFPNTAGSPNEPTSFTLSSIQFPAAANALAAPLDTDYTVAGNPFPTVEGFLTVLSADFKQITYTTYIGGTLDDMTFGPSFDPSGNVIVTGWTDGARQYAPPGKTPPPYTAFSPLPGLISTNVSPVKSDPDSFIAFPITLAYGVWSTQGSNTPFFIGSTVGRDGFVARINVGQAPPVALSAFSFAPPSIGSGASSVGTVTLTTPASSAGITVKIVVGATGASAVTLSGPNITKDLVSDPTGHTYNLVITSSATGTFTATANLVTANTTVNFTATYGTATLTSSLTVTPPSFSLALSPTTLVGATDGSKTVVGTITLATANTSDLTFTISSSDTTIVPITSANGTVTIPAGQKTATFTLVPTGVKRSSPVTITATLGSLSQTATLTVNPVSLTTLTPVQRTIRSGTGYLVLNAFFDQPTVDGGVVVVSFSTGGVFTGPTTRAVGRGFTATNPFPILFNTNRVSRSVDVTVTVTYYPSGVTTDPGTTQSTFVTVTR